MLSSGVESQEKSHPHPLDSSMSAVVQELYNGLPVSISTEITPGSDANVRLDAKPEASTLVLAHNSSLLSECHRICGVENCPKETDNLDNGGKLISQEVVGSLSEESMESRNLAENEEAKTGILGKQDICANRSQKEERGSVKKTQDVQQELVGYCSLASEEKRWLRQDPQINQSGKEVSRICCTEMAEPLKSKDTLPKRPRRAVACFAWYQGRGLQSYKSQKVVGRRNYSGVKSEENQTNVQVTPEILPKPTEEIQGMKAVGTRIFSKAGHGNYRVSKGLPTETNECPDIDIITASGEVSETSTLFSIEPLTVVETGSTKEYPHEEKEYKGLTTCTTISLTTRDCTISYSETGEIGLFRSSHVNGSNITPASYQTYEQDEENNPHNYSAFHISQSSEVDIPLSKESSEALRAPLKSLCGLDSENMPLEENTEFCEIQEAYLANERERPSCNGGSQRTEFLKNWISRPVMEEQLSPVQSGEIATDKAEQLEMDSCTDHSPSCGYGKVAEIRRETATKNSCDMNNGHDVHSESSDLPIPSSVASSAEFPPGDLISSEINFKKDGNQWQIGINDVCWGGVVKRCTKENNTLLVNTKNLVSIKTGDLHTCSSNGYNKYANSLPTVHDSLDYGTKLDDVFLEAPLVEKEVSSSSVIEDLDNSSEKTPEAISVNVNLPTYKETNFTCTSSEALGHDAKESRVPLGLPSEPYYGNADAVSNRDLCLDRLPKNMPLLASAKLEAQSVGLQLKNEELSLANHSFNITYVTSKGSQKSMNSVLRRTKKIVTNMENEKSDTCIHNDQYMEYHCSAVKDCFILSDGTSLDNAMLNKDSFKAQIELKTEKATCLETQQLLVPNDEKAVSLPEENIHLACESVPRADDWNCNCVFKKMPNYTSAAERLLHSAGILDDLIMDSLEVKSSNTNIEVESLKRYDDACENTKERLDSDNIEKITVTGKGQEQINSCALQKDEKDKIEILDSVNAYKDSHHDEASEQSVSTDVNKSKDQDGHQIYNTTVVLGERELKMYKTTALPCEYHLSEDTVSKSDADSSIPSHKTCSKQSFDLELSCFQHSEQLNDTVCQVENQNLACQIELIGPVSHKQNETRVSNEVLEFQHCDLDNSKHISNTGVQTITSSVEQPVRAICSKENELLTLKDEKRTRLIHEFLEEKIFQGPYQKIMVDTDLSEYTVISDSSEAKKVELKESNNVGAGSREDHGIFKDSTVNADHSEYTDSVSSAKEDQKEYTILVENSKLSPLVNIGSLVMDPENKIKTIVDSFSVFLSASKSLSCVPEETAIIPGIRRETCLLLDSAVNHRIVEIKKTCPQSGFVTFTVADGPESKNPVQSEEFCVNQELSSAKDVISETPLALSSEICLPQRDELLATSWNVQIADQDSSSTNALCNDYSATDPLVQTLERRTDSSDSSSEAREKAISSLNEVKLEVYTASHARSSESSVSAGDSESVVKEMDVTSSDNSDCVADHSELVSVKLLSETVDSYLESKDLINSETSDIHQTTDSRKPSKNDTEASLKCLDFSEVCQSYELSSHSKDNSNEVRDSMKTPHDSVSAENEVPDAERLAFTYFVQALKQQMCEETEVCPARNFLLHVGHMQQIQESKDQESAKIPFQGSVVYDTESLEASDELVVSSVVTKTESPRKQFFAAISSISDDKQIYSTLQEVKRPKISKNDDSEHMKTMTSEVESLSVHLGSRIELSADNTPLVPFPLSLPQAKSFAKDDEIHGAFRNTCKSKRLFPVKQQTKRKCVKTPTWDELKTVRENKKVKSSAFKRNSPDAVPMQEHNLLSPIYFARTRSAKKVEIARRLNLMSKKKANKCSLLNRLKLSKCTKEPTLLSRLSTMASNLLALPKSSHKLKTLQCSSELPMIERSRQTRSKRLLEVFSCINMKIKSQQGDGLCTKMFSFQPLALYPVVSSKMYILDLSSNIPSVFNTPISPISFHINLDFDSLINLTGITSQHCVPDRPALGEALVHPCQPSKWTFSFLLPQSCSDITAFREDTKLSNELHSSGLSLTTTEAVTSSDNCRRNPIAKRAGCSMLGLHTVLALSSPQCYRIWTRRRNVTSRIPTVQRLFISQITQGLTGLRSPNSVSDDLFSSLPNSLGKVLALWIQHGPSACPSEFTPLHSNHCKWQPSLGIESSYVVLPHMTVLGPKAARTTGVDIRLEHSLSDWLPKSCMFPELAISPLRLSVPEFQVHPFDALDASLSLCPTSQRDTELKKAEPEKKPKRVSQIRIRKTVPKPDPNLTPMGLPRRKRLKKKEFSLEEIYTNKNYKSPPMTRCLETIFEEPKEKNGSLISISQQKRKRILEFQDFTIPRKRKTRSRVKVAGSFTRAKKAAVQGREIDALLVQKLMDLDAFFAEEDEKEQSSGS
ncbi:protein PRR14L isoform X2 [Pelodiscus sinensis]|uniref:protein PRR14L isoform X2 n=1 Tax=Pelodiscus sinensis TaxID=13735 RepID=UPI003F6CAA41